MQPRIAAAHAPATPTLARYQAAIVGFDQKDISSLFSECDRRPAARHGHRKPIDHSDSGFEACLEPPELCTVRSLERAVEAEREKRHPLTDRCRFAFAD